MLRSDWLLWRSGGIGASDVPSILGVSPYRNILDIYNDKINPSTEEKTSYIMELGNIMEPIARANYEIITGYEFSACNVEHSEIKHYRCSLDGFNKELNKVIEIKYCGKNFTEICPDKYYPQVQYQYAITNCVSLDLVQINDDKKINIIPIERNDEYIIDMLKKVDEFWNCVVSKTPPEFIPKEKKCRKKKTAIEKM